MSKPLKRVLIMAGGTGGHVFPGLALADYLREQGVEVHWLGTAQGIEAKLVPEAKYPLHLVQITGLRGKGVLAKLLAPVKVVKAMMASIAIIKSVNPDVVVGMGGFVSGPGGVAAWLTGRPLVIHEQNAIAGFTNKLLSLFAKRVLMGFPNAFAPSSRNLAVGNPVRVAIENIPAPAVRFAEQHEPLRLLVLGGSLGAMAINQVVPEAMASFADSERPIVVHQTGDKHFAEVKKIYESKGVEVTLSPFVKDMADVYSTADLVVCRAGALTVAELCAAGVGAIFVPFPFAVDDHQTANAKFMVDQGAALCIQQSDLTASRLADIVREFAHSKPKRVAMAEAAYQLRQVGVVKKIYAVCQEVCT